MRAMIKRLKNLTSLFQRSAPAAASLSNSPSSNALPPHLILGQRGERLAAAYLAAAGYRLVASNFTIPIGRNRRTALVYGEIDLIAYEGETLCFIEVKTRTSDAFAAPETAVDRRKQRQISRAARAYRRAFNLHNVPYRFDVVSIVAAPRETASEVQTEAWAERSSASKVRAAKNFSSAPRVEIRRNYWTDARFRKRLWQDAPDDF